MLVEISELDATENRKPNGSRPFKTRISGFESRSLRRLPSLDSREPHFSGGVALPNILLESESEERARVLDELEKMEKV